MKRILAVVLTVLMCASMVMLASCTTSQTQTKPAEQPTPSAPASEGGKTTPTPAQTDDTGDTPNDIFKTLTITKNEPEHQKADSLPASSTLVGSDTLPAIDNRNGIDCQAAEAITYMQFTNAVARFVKSKDPANTWSPATNYASCYSPKSTFYGTGTGCSYYMLQELGAFTNEVDGFVKNTTGGSIIKRNGAYLPASIAWKIGEGSRDNSMNYRLRSYSAICTSDTKNYTTGTGYYDATTKGVRVTDSDNGKALLEKIKDAIATGNVVVVQGYSDHNVTEKLESNTGTLGKKGDTVIPYATVHKETVTQQLCIVGYDDDFEYTSCGVTMKGAFQLAGSNGTAWGTNGYMFVMYDALNTDSEFGEDFKLPEETKREPAFDWFYFVYWDTDIIDAMPRLYGEVELSVANRNGFQIHMLCTDAMNRTISSQSMITWCASNYAPKYDLATGSYFNPEGIENGPEADGFYTFSFDSLLNNIPDGTTYEDFLWGVRITSKDSKTTVTVKSLKIKTADGTVVASLDLGDGESFTKENYTYYFDFGKDKVKNTLSGSYNLTNVASGKAIGKDGLMKVKPVDSAADAAKFILEADSKTGKIVFKRDDEKYVLDAMTAMQSGNSLQFNAEDTKGRGEFQLWTVSYNDDGTFSFYLTSAKGTNYALAEVDGAICITKASALTDAMKWTVNRITDNSVLSLATVKTDAGVKVVGTVSAKKTEKLTVKVVKADDASEVLSTEATVKDKAFEVELAVKDAGTYYVRFYDPANENALATGMIVLTVQ